ncbi:MAG: hemolysin family protein [Dysosmobacter sp.]|nr:hemolysin family protein [Dysosmobacter sp.]
MDDGSILSVLIILALLLFADYFAVCETSFAAVSRIRLKTAMERGDRRANKAMYVCERFDKAITTILIGTNIVHLSCASYVTVLVTRRWGLSAVTLSTFVTTLVVFFVGEMLPKSFAKKYSLRLALGTASSLVFFMHLLTPVSFVLTKIGEFASRLTKGDSEVSVTEDELYDIIENMTDEGDLDSEQGDLVHSALAFGDLTAESILTARVDMETIDVDDPLEEILAQVKASRHSRIPVYQDSVDNIIGVLQIRRFMREYLQKREKTDLRSLLDEPYFVHQSAKIDELLSVMSSKKINMTIVTDSYGGTVGIVTVEDILEELVGEIWDEDDEVVEPCVDHGDGSYSFDAGVDIEDAFEFMDYEDPDETDFDHKLLGEWAYEQFDAIPKEGDSFTYNGLRVTVEKVQQRRIMKLHIQRLPEGGEKA